MEVPGRVARLGFASCRLRPASFADRVRRSGAGFVLADVHRHRVGVRGERDLLGIVDVVGQRQAQILGRRIDGIFRRGRRGLLEQGREQFVEQFLTRLGRAAARDRAVFSERIGEFAQTPSGARRRAAGGLRHTGTGRGDLRYRCGGAETGHAVTGSAEESTGHRRKEALGDRLDGELLARRRDGHSDTGETARECADETDEHRAPDLEGRPPEGAGGTFGAGQGARDDPAVAGHLARARADRAADTTGAGRDKGLLLVDRPALIVGDLFQLRRKVDAATLCHTDGTGLPCQSQRSALRGCLRAQPREIFQQFALGDS
ncbi:hypothetical protein [Nocardia mexicana]|uniref:hypothetical protein n=1 Tax=Nocardia mexicana TaxID=279262 RepID=UPI0020D269EC|nr:hypothetical protein [Nocardia mexicana]